MGARLLGIRFWGMLSYTVGIKKPCYLSSLLYFLGSPITFTKLVLSWGCVFLAFKPLVAVSGCPRRLFPGSYC